MLRSELIAHGCIVLDVRLLGRRGLEFQQAPGKLSFVNEVQPCSHSGDQ
jgi:FixJ family two-component response regulator